MNVYEGKLHGTWSAHPTPGACIVCICEHDSPSGDIFPCRFVKNTSLWYTQDEQEKNNLDWFVKKRENKSALKNLPSHNIYLDWRFG